MKPTLPDVENQSARMGLAALGDVCLIFVNGDISPLATVLREAARGHRWLLLDVELIHAENGPWTGAAMPGSAKGCGIFAGAEVRSYLARSDPEGIYLSATLDQLLYANGVRCLCVVGEAPIRFLDAMRNFAVSHGYMFEENPPDAIGRSVASARKSLMGNFRSRLSPENAALLLIDFQNDFCSISGAAERTGATLSMVTGAVSQGRDLLAAARQRGIFIVHIRAEYGKHWRSTSSPFRFPVQGRREPAVWTASASDQSTNLWFREDETEVCRSGTWGAEFVDGLGPESGEAVITKHRFGAFAGTGLDQLLRARGLSSLIVAGVTTNCCVETTVREAVMREFSVIVAEDAVAVKDHLEDLHRASLEAFATYFGLVRPTSEIIAEWNANISTEERKFDL